MKGESGNHTKAILDYSYPFILISLGFIALTEIDTMMLGILSTAEQVGVYSVAKQFVQKLPHLSLAIAMGTMPVFAGLNGSNKELMRKRLMNILKINSGIYLVIIAFLLAFAPFVISMLFGKEYAAAALSLQILTIYLFCYATSIILSGFLDYTGRANKRALNMTLAIGANIILNIVLIPKYGAAGASAATSISFIPYVIMNWLEVRKALSRPDRP
jgi:O-antigen/teichoic acid export membrane protein